MEFLDNIFGIFVVIGLILGPAGILAILLILLAIVLASCKVNHEIIYPILDLAQYCNYKAASSEFYKDIEYDDGDYYEYIDDDIYDEDYDDIGDDMDDYDDE